ncbi:MFS transporter [Saccharicrinis sp. FJH62]|uniref:MFS transporter n=1 Tax=Saccharicrinis sp. FJH62 TaxID=3344657 RepID=UPI0035D4AA0C
MSKTKSNWSLLLIAFIERFAFYLFNSSLILYLFSGDNFSEEKSLAIYSIFKILIYSLPIIMGIVSDIMDRKKVFMIGLILSIIGYALIPILSFNYWLLIFSIVILAIGIAILKPNITVFIGDNSSQTGNIKRLFRDFVQMVFLISLAPMIVNGINDSFTDKTLVISIISSSILILIVFLIYHFISPKNNHQPVDNDLKPKQPILLLSSIFVLAFIVIVLTNKISPMLAIETEGSELTFQNITNFFSVPVTIILLVILAIKSIRIQLNSIALLLGLTTIGFSLIFLSIYFDEFSKFSFSPDSKLSVLALIVVFETLFYPIIILLLYKFSTKYKGFVLGLYYSLIAWIAISFSKMDLDRLYLLIPIIILIMLGIVAILKRNNIKTICT